ncbi:biotin-independent malonate decarboxylase subunit gamma [Corynebacterium variabile]|uniref:biotin-independent malonate decarboxylase subunit gamma n=1 Tax=Corynebacterium variabile TaxID=1727 RepID=UPI00289EBD3F|nr:biotin-independent malonate decarboxylase subunit gamma [Corynebacterium variabile]
MTDHGTSYGTAWFSALDTSGADTSGSLLTGHTVLADGTTAALAAVVPDPDSRFPRARHGEVGLRESLDLAAWVNSLDDPDMPLVIVVDVPSQAYGFVEEQFGLNTTMATAVNAIASTRLAGRPVISLVVGNAISGAFLTTGLQANRIVMLDHDGVQVQVMGKTAAARITRRTVEAMEKAAESVPAMAFDGASFVSLGGVFESLVAQNPAEPGADDILAVKDALDRALVDIRDSGTTDLRSRLESRQAQTARALSRTVRQVVDERW